MRFLANAHLVVLGLLSLGITAYAQQTCIRNENCGPDRCCGSRRVRSLDSFEHARNHG
jgi:hypothetical protein